MRTIPSRPNQPLRDSLRQHLATPGREDLRRTATNALLASTLAITHDGSLRLREDGSLPKGQPLPLGIWRDGDESFQLTAFTDRVALLEPSSPTRGELMPAVPLAGDDLILLAASNGVGVHVNPGSVDHLSMPVGLVRDVASRIRERRAAAGVRAYDERTLVTMRPPAADVHPDLRALLVRELRGRGVHFAFVAEYAMHDRTSEPGEFKQVVVVGDEEGLADYQMREDARTVLWYLTERETDSVAYASMPQVERVVGPIVASGKLPEVPSAGIV